MRIESAGSAVGFVGCLIDWLITRDWRRVALGLLPVFFAVVVGGLVAWGSMLDRDRLAERYLKLADAEVAQWENAWAPESHENAQASATVDGKAEDGAASDSSEQAERDEQKTIPHFAEVLFRRVQQLNAGDQRSVFFVAMTLAQRDSLPQALALLSRIAPDDREGYAPAHAWLTEYYLRHPITGENLKTVKHHARAALRWSRTPPSLLAAIGQLFWRTGEPDVAVQSLTIAAERDPRFNLQLAGLASGGEKWKLLREKSISKAETHLEEMLTRSPQDIDARLQLISTHLLKKDFAKAEQLASEGRKLEDDPRLRRAQSEIYRLQFASSMSMTEAGWSGNVELLNKAFHVDPTNLQVFDAVAQLARMTGEAPNAELEAELNRLLAEGKATSITHLWIAERHLVSNEMEKAVPHLEQALERSPNAVQCLNNLAYCLAALYPNRRSEALSYVDRAIAINGNHPAYHDTRGSILVSLNRPKEAIAAFERAVELLHQSGLPPKATYHQRLAATYASIGQEQLAAEHKRIAARLLQQDSKAESKADVQAPEESAGSAESTDAAPAEDASEESADEPSPSSQP